MGVPAWVSEWISGEPVDVSSDESAALEDLRDQPDAVVEAMIAFPMKCVVKTILSGLGESYGYSMGCTDETCDGLPLICVRFPKTETVLACRQSDLEVVAFWRGITSDVMRKALG